MFGNNFYGRLIYGIARKLIAWTPPAPSEPSEPGADTPPTPPEPTFDSENAKGVNKPSIIVELEESRLENEQTTQADWAAASFQIDIDYTPTPPNAGDVILTTFGQLGNEENQTGNTWALILNDSSLQGRTNDNQNWQSFKRNVGMGNNTLRTVQGYFYRFILGGGSYSVSCELWSAGKGAKIGTTVGPININSETGEWISFDFISQNIPLQKDTEYWIKFIGGGAASSGNSWQKYQNTTVYAQGQFDRTGTSPGINLGDLMFIVHMETRYYSPSGYIRTQTIDMGQTPTNDGEWVLDDIQPSGTSITYQAWASSTGAFAGEETDLGAITDGTVITNLKRYYRVKATLTASSDGSQTPTLHSIKCIFSQYKIYTNNDALPYELGILNISSLATAIDTFKPSTISELSITMTNIPSLITYLTTKYPKNKTVKTKIGYKGLTRAQHIDYLWGQIRDVNISAKDQISITTRDFKTEWDKNVPEKWQSAGDNVTWTAQHPIDVMLDILQNKINVRDSKINIDSFNTVKTALSGWQVTRTITGNPENAKTLMEELRLLMSCFFLPQPDGKIKIKQWNTNETAVDTLTDADVLEPGFVYKGNYDSLINKTAIYYNWDGSGNDAADFTSLDLALDATSQTNYDEIALKEIKDKWTLSAQSAQSMALRTNILNRYADPVPILIASIDLRKIDIEAGDIVKIITRRHPSYPTEKSFQIIKRNLDFMNHKIELTMLEV